MYVNDTCVLGFTHHDMVTMFQSIATGELVSLEVSFKWLSMQVLQVMDAKMSYRFAEGTHCPSIQTILTLRS